MSWLLVAFVPGLLILMTLGLGRLEASLSRDTVTASDVAEFLEQAGAADMCALAREGMSEALDCLHRRRAERFNEGVEHRSNGCEHHPGAFTTADEPGLPTRRHEHSRANRQFGPTRHANRV